MSTSEYYELSFRYTGDLDLISAFLFSRGALGVEESLEFYQPPGSPELQVSADSQRQIKAYFSKLPELDEMTTWVKSYDLTKKKSLDWTAEFKKSWKPIELSGGFWIVPSWESSPASVDKSVFIDPGMAFGTGTHETTQIMSEFLIENQNHLESAQSLLDVGTGSGVLSILSQKLGVKSISATELDKKSQEVAESNFIKNKANVTLLDPDLSLISKKYEFVLANILENVLLDLKNDLFKICKTNLIVSGVLAKNSSEFKDQFLEPGMELYKEVHKGEWVGLWIRV